MNLEQFISGQAGRNHDFPQIVKFHVEQLIVMHMKKNGSKVKVFPKVAFMWRFYVLK